MLKTKSMKSVSHTRIDREIVPDRATEADGPSVGDFERPDLVMSQQFREAGLRRIACEDTPAQGLHYGPSEQSKVQDEVDAWRCSAGIPAILAHFPDQDPGGIDVGRAQQSFRAYAVDVARAELLREPAKRASLEWSRQLVHGNWSTNRSPIVGRERGRT